jgi:hypothetical protein
MTGSQRALKFAVRTANLSGRCIGLVADVRRNGLILTHAESFEVEDVPEILLKC